MSTSILCISFYVGSKLALRYAVGGDCLSWSNMKKKD